MKVRTKVFHIYLASKVRFFIGTYVRTYVRYESILNTKVPCLLGTVKVITKVHTKPSYIRTKINTNNTVSFVFILSYLS